MELDTAGRGFLNALTQYLKERLQTNDADSDQHVKRYGIYLEAVGYEPDTPVYNEFMEHMRRMKDAGRFPKV